MIQYSTVQCNTITKEKQKNKRSDRILQGYLVCLPPSPHRIVYLLGHLFGPRRMPPELVSSLLFVPHVLFLRISALGTCNYISLFWFWFFSPLVVLGSREQRKRETKMKVKKVIDIMR